MKTYVVREYSIPFIHQATRDQIKETEFDSMAEAKAFRSTLGRTAEIYVKEVRDESI